MINIFAMIIISYTINIKGDAEGMIAQAHCFWLTGGDRDTLHLFNVSELSECDNGLNGMDMLHAKNFAKALGPLYRPCVEDIGMMKSILQKLESGNTRG